MKIKIPLDKLIFIPWGDNFTGEVRYVNFTLDDIKACLDEGHFDARNFQEDRIKIYEGREANYEEWFDSFRLYHIRRIAYLINSDKWKCPIRIRIDMTIEDGQHRYWAAKALGETEIDAIEIWKQ